MKPTQRELHDPEWLVWFLTNLEFHMLKKRRNRHYQLMRETLLNRLVKLSKSGGKVAPFEDVRAARLHVESRGDCLYQDWQGEQHWKRRKTS